ncbi:unnamed protein product [Arctia plantaginis]|uniref:Uncharacterized protein n=1 Tax=Arctia plantaginis TaxID=874455 RepID=A0A8S0ZSC2_ARCPL|nr:unnamed protein product [Arctia plantaginis]
MANKSRTLMEIFQEIYAASGNTSGSSINETQIVSVLREQAMKGERHEDEIGDLLVKMMKDANLPLKPDTCGYCEGNFRDVIMAYNSLHGYVSLLCKYLRFRTLGNRVS